MKNPYNNQLKYFSFILIAIILLHLYTSSDLLSYIDEYIKVHYSLTNINKSILLIIPLLPKNYKLVYNIRKDKIWLFLDKYNKGIKTSSIQNYNKKNDIDKEININSPELIGNKRETLFSDNPLNLVKKQSESNESKKISIPLSQNTRKLSVNTTNLSEGDWREIWSRKYHKLLRLGFYTPDLWDRLLFVFLNEKKENIKSKYTFNKFFSGSQLISYNFNKNIKKVDLNSLYNYFKSFFKTLSSLISVPVLEVFPDKVKIRLFYYVVPSKKKQKIHKILHKYIRNDEKLYKEIILRRNFKRKMEQFKMKLFIAKWKEDNDFIRIPNPISILKGFTLGPVNLPLKEESNLDKFSNSYESLVEKENNSRLSDKISRLIPLTTGKGVRCTLNTPDSQFYRSNEFNTSLDLLKLDFSKFSLQDDKLESLLRDLHNIKRDKNSKMTGMSVNPLEENLKINKPEAEELKYKNMSLYTSNSAAFKALGGEREISNYLNEPMLAESLSENQNDRPSRPVSHPAESLKTLRNRTVSTIVSLNKEKFKYFIFTLEKLFKKTVILDLVRLKYPYHESNILAQVLSLSCKTKDFRQIMRKLLYTATIGNPTKMVRHKNMSIVPSYLSGIKVRLGGRLITQRVVPRFTIQSLQIGSLARGKVNFTDSSRITLKNKRGAFSFTVTTSHIF
uniref:Small ribosomal subunit protein uS3m n=1 Tax=Turbinellus floccosus TaxID=288723 RepID=A0A649UBC0_9AGAM|nr:ribosomal protein S3 [Turbinellus floccosus]QGI24498.1 ribosomal protein S3 [Turbinellus floccosus]